MPVNPVETVVAEPELPQSTEQEIHKDITPLVADNELVEENTTVAAVTEDAEKIEEVETLNNVGAKTEDITTEVIVEEERVTEHVDEPYDFVMVQELASIKLRDITLADTTLYVADGDLYVHTVASDETLTKIARKYFGERRWKPYRS